MRNHVPSLIILLYYASKKTIDQSLTVKGKIKIAGKKLKSINHMGRWKRNHLSSLIILLCVLTNNRSISHNKRKAKKSRKEMKINRSHEAL
jgi:hypothetical protein